MEEVILSTKNAVGEGMVCEAIWVAVFGLKVEASFLDVDEGV